MDDQRTFVASYTSRSHAERAARALGETGGRFTVPSSPLENGEWPVHAIDAMAPAPAERTRRRLLRAPLPPPTSW